MGGGGGGLPTGLTFVSPTLTVSSATNGNGQLALSGNTSGTATITAPATAGVVTNPIAISNAIQLPTTSGGVPSITWVSGTNAGIGSHTPNTVDMLGGSVDYYTSAAALSAQTSSGATSFEFTTIAVNSSFQFFGNITTGTSHAGLELFAEGGNLTATSGTQIAANISGDSAAPDAFAPSSGTANFVDLMVSPKINQTGGANGTIDIIGAFPLNTAVVGAENCLGAGTTSAQGNAGTLTRKFTVDCATGNTTSLGAVSGATYLSATKCAAVGTAANPSVVTCAAAPTGIIYCDVAASAGTCQINTSIVTANSTILITSSSADGTLLSKTCNTSPTVLPANILLSKNAGVSFTLNMPTETVNGSCFEYTVIN